VAAVELALLVMTFWTRRRHRRVRHPAVGVVAGHLFATVPDLLVAGGVRQGRWMDVFLGNVSAHYAPVGNVTWLVLAVAAAVTYVRTALPATADEAGVRGTAAAQAAVEADSPHRLRAACCARLQGIFIVLARLPPHPRPIIVDDDEAAR